MKRLAEALCSLAITVWVGGLIAIGYLAAPVLFSTLADKGLAGELAGRMFTVVAWIGLGCGAYIVLYFLAQRGLRALTTGGFWVVAGMLALTVAGHFGIQPVLAQLKADALPRQVMESALRDRFATWHGISSVLYLLQTVLGAWLVVLQERGRR